MLRITYRVKICALSQRALTKNYTALGGNDSAALYTAHIVRHLSVLVWCLHSSAFSLQFTITQELGEIHTMRWEQRQTAALYSFLCAFFSFYLHYTDVLQTSQPLSVHISALTYAAAAVSNASISAHRRRCRTPHNPSDKPLHIQIYLCNHHTYSVALKCRSAVLLLANLKFLAVLSSGSNALDAPLFTHNADCNNAENKNKKKQK